MLFDLRDRRRRRTIQAVYLSLAVLMGGGLVLFGIGGEVSGGLFDAFSSNSGTSSEDTFEKRAEELQAQVEASPQDAAAWSALARARFQAAGVGENFQDNRFTESGLAELRLADQAWQRHLRLAGDAPDADVAGVMVNVYSEFGLNDPAKAADAQEVVITAQGDKATARQFATLSIYAAQAGQTRKAELAKERALELATDKAERDALERSIDDAAGASAAEAPAG